MNTRKSIFAWYFKSSLLLRILIGLLLGALTGIIGGSSILWISPLGDIFIRLLKMIVMPVILASIIVGTASISPKELGKIGLKIIVFYLFTSALAVTIGLLMGNLLKSGIHLALDNTVDAAGKMMKTPPSFISTLLSIIPKNIFSALSSGMVLPTIFFAIIFGIGIAYLRDQNNSRMQKIATTLFDFFEGAAEIMYLIVRGILHYAPIGVFSLIAVVFAKQGAKAIGPLGMVTLTTYLGFILQIVIIYSVLLMLGKFNPWVFLKKVQTPMLTAFVTRSSSGTLPVTMNAVDKELGVSRNVYSFTLPLGATINMDGTAIYLGVCVLFISFAIGAPLSFAQQITVVITAVLASIGTAGVPGAGVIMLLMVLNSVGLSVDAGTPAAAAYALILGIDAILDMGRTAVNVTGDMTGTLLIAKSEGEFDASRWDKKV